MTKQEQRTLYESVMKQIAPVVKQQINNFVDNIELVNDISFRNFLRKVSSVTISDIQQTKQNIINAMNHLNEDVEDAKDYILTNSSLLSPQIHFQRVEKTLEELVSHPNDNYRELMMYFYSDYCAELQ